MEWEIFMYLKLNKNCNIFPNVLGKDFIQVNTAQNRKFNTQDRTGHIQSDQLGGPVSAQK